MISIENLSSPSTVPQTPQNSKLHPPHHRLPSFSTSCPPKTSLPASGQPETCETSITTATTKLAVGTILAAANDLGNTKEGAVSSSSYDDNHDKCKSNGLQEPETVGYQLPHQDSLPKFSIRGYVFASRKADVCNNWPFSNKSLQLCLKHGVKDLLPPFQALGTLCDSPIGISTVGNNAHREVRSSSRSDKISSLPSDNQLTSDSSTGKERKLAPQHCPHVETRRDEKDLESNSSIPCQSALESVSTNKLSSEIYNHREEDAALAAAMCDSNGILSEPSNKQTSLALDTKSSHKLNDCTPMSELAAPCELMASKVCPVCGTFSSSSNTTLNAHIDQCLSMNTSSDKKDYMNTSADHKKENLPISKPRVKPTKIRLMTDIYATARCCTLEDLDRRNGTNWVSESSNILSEATEAVAGLKKQRVLSRQICDIVGDGAVYIDADGTKIRVLSSFDDTPSASKTATDLRMKKSVKDDRPRKSIAPNKECLAAKHDKQSPQRKEFSLKRCSLKAGRYDEANREVEGCQRDRKHRSPASRDEQQNKLTDAGMLKKWVRSKRTGFSKRSTNLRIPCHSVREVEERREIAADGDQLCPGKSCLRVDVLKHSTISENCISSVNSLKVDEVSIEAGAGNDWCSPKRKRLDAPLCRGPKRAGMNSTCKGAVTIHRGDGDNWCSPKRKRLGAPSCRGPKRAGMNSMCRDAVEIHQGDGDNLCSPRRKRLDAPLCRGPQCAGMNSPPEDANEICRGAVERVDRSVCSSRTSDHPHAFSSEGMESVSMKKKLYLPSTSPGPSQQLKGDKNDSFLMCRLNRVSEEMVQWPAEVLRSDSIQDKKHSFAKTSAETSHGYHKQAEERSNDCLDGLAGKLDDRDSPSALAMERTIERDADLHEFRTRIDTQLCTEEYRAHSFTEESAESALGYYKQGEERSNGCLDGVADKPEGGDSPSALVIGRTLERCTDLHEYPTLFDTQQCPEDYQVHSFKEASAPQTEPSSGADEVGHDSAELKIADNVLNVRPDSSFLVIDPIPIPGPPGSDLPSPRDMEADVLRVNQSLMNSQVHCWYYKPKEMADGDSQESPTSATTTISNLMEVVSDSKNSEPCMESHPVNGRRLQERDNPSLSAVDTRHEEKATRWPQSEISDVDGVQRGVISQGNRPLVSAFTGQSCCSWKEGISCDTGSTIGSEDLWKGSTCSVMTPAVGSQVINQAISGTERPSTQSPGEKLVGRTMAREVAACGTKPPITPSHCDSPPSISPSTLVFRLMGKNLTIINNDKSTHAWVQPVFNSCANKGASTISGTAHGDQEPHHVGVENDRLWQGYL